MGNKNKIPILILLLIIICEFSYSQISNRYSSLRANINYFNQPNLIDSSGRMHGRFVFSDNPYNDTIQSKYEAYFIDDSLVSDLKYYKNDTIYFGHFSYWKKQLFKTEVSLTSIKQEGDWFYMTKNQDTLSCDIFLYLNDFIAPYYSIYPKIPITIYNYSKQEPTFFYNYTRLQYQKYFYKVINDTSRLDSVCITNESYKNEIRKYYPDGCLKYWKYESFKSFMNRVYDFEKEYFENGLIKRDVIIINKRKRFRGLLGERCYRLILLEKEIIYNIEGEKL